MLTKQIVSELILTKDAAVARALVVLNDRQTADEQATKDTRVLNGMGFKPCHARMGTSMAQFFQRAGYLSPKQLAYWRKLDKSGYPKLACYWKQLSDAAEQKKLTKTVENVEIA